MYVSQLDLYLEKVAGFKKSIVQEKDLSKHKSRGSQKSPLQLRKRFTDYSSTTTMPTTNVVPTTATTSSITTKTDGHPMGRSDNPSRN
jgi:hypothetical protein